VTNLLCRFSTDRDEKGRAGGKVNKTFLRIALAITILLAPQSRMQAQQNLVGFDILGRAGIYSVNYERYSRWQVGGGGGLAYWNIGGQRAVITPIYISATPLGKTNSVYAAGGITLGVSNLDLISSSRPYSTTIVGTVTAGYQHKSAGGFVVRPTVTFFYDRHSAFCCWPGVMIGHAF
jgi:hypothetical protein